jgi:hypothetical protein
MKESELEKLGKEYANITYRVLMYESDSVPCKADLKEAHKEGFKAALQYIRNMFPEYSEDCGPSDLIELGMLVKLCKLED